MDYVCYVIELKRSGALERSEFFFVSDDAELVARVIGVMCHFPKDHVDPTIRFLEKVRRKRLDGTRAGRELVSTVEETNFDDQVDGYWFVCMKGFRVVISLSPDRIFDWDVHINLCNGSTAGFIRLYSVLEGLPSSTRVTRDGAPIDVPSFIATLEEVHFAEL